VRGAAVLGLAKYPGAKARRRLIALAHDFELQAEAIRALRTGHRHEATIDLFAELLRLRGCRIDSVRQMQQALHDWTGFVVEDRPSEIEQFRRWWEENRASWAAENAARK
jgi:hypothetical protein